MDAIGKEFERHPPGTFVVSLTAGATQEMRPLNLIPFIDSSVARSIWKVLVSLQPFSWSFEEVLQWSVCDVNRPSVPMLGDDAAALQACLHEVDQIKSFTNIEAAGLKLVLLSFVPFRFGRP